MTKVRALVPGYEHDIFVSYASVNDTPSEGVAKGWVTTFINELKKGLAWEYGSSEAFSIWSNHELAGNVPISSQILDNLKASATLVMIFSRAYMSSAWCRKEQTNFVQTVQEHFHADTRVFVVELDKTERPQEFSELSGYRFFVEDPVSGRSHPLGWPQPHPEKDRNYYDAINDLSKDLVKELETLKTQYDTEEKKTVSEKAESRATVLLAEVTDDLYYVRTDVKRYLEQHNIKVLPEKNYPRDPRLFQQAVQSDLANSQLFVQLLSEVPFKEYPDLSQGFVRYQYELAREAGTEIIQWRPPELNVKALQDNEQRDFLQGKKVRAERIETFKAEIVKKVTPPESPDAVPPQAIPYVFVSKHDNDVALAERICQILRDTCRAKYSSPLSSISRDAVAKRLMKSDGLLLVYGEANIEWIEDRYWELDEILRERGRELTRSAVYDGPPEDKPGITFGDPKLMILKCRDCLKEEELCKFIDALRPGGSA